MIDLNTFTGRVVRKQISKGSRNVVANVFNTECGKEFVLRREGRSGLNDPDLDALDGKKIKAIGTIQSYVFIIASFDIENN